MKNKSNNIAESEFKLSIIIPVYNEDVTVHTVIEKILKIKFNKEIIVVNDGSTDGTTDILKQYDKSEIKIVCHRKNLGKGAAIRTGFINATGDILLIQDADLEYNPDDYPALLEPIISGKADVVYGSRFSRHGAHAVHSFWHYTGNRILTHLSNIFSNIYLTDMETCYKVFNKKAIEGIELCQNRFGFEPEITAKIAKKRLRIFEVPITYQGRSYAEGKKIKWKDGFNAVWCIIKYNLFS